MILGRTLVIASLIATTSLAQNLRQGDAAEHRELAGSPTKSPSTGMHKPTWKPSSKPAEHRQLAGSPTKSPSTGMHKPTWKPSSKPAEHRALQAVDPNAPVRPQGTMKDSSANPPGVLPPKTADAEVTETVEVESAPVVTSLLAKGGKTGHGPPHVATPTMTPKTNKPAEHRMLSKNDVGPPRVATPTMTPKTNKPAEHRMLSKKDVGPPRVATPTMTPKTNKPAEHRMLSATFKPNEKKTSKPAEKKSSIGAALPRSLTEQLKPAAKGAAPATEDVPTTPDGGHGPPHVATPTMEPKSMKPVEHKNNVVTADSKDAVLGDSIRPEHTVGEKDTENRHTENAARSLSGAPKSASNPTKSPSTGMHKPTWRPSSKPAEHRQLSATFKPNEKKTSKPAEKKSSIGAALPRKLTVQPPEGIEAKHPLTTETVAVADPAPGPPHVSTPTMTPRTSTKPVESKVQTTSAQMHDGVKATRPVHQENESDPEGRHRALAGAPTKSPSTGMHKPTWKPSSKPNERR